MSRGAALSALVLGLAAAGCGGKLVVEVEGAGQVNITAGEEVHLCKPDKGSESGEVQCTFELSGDATLSAASLGAAAKFQSWTGDCIGDNPVCTLEVAGEKKARARFISNHIVKLEVTGDGVISSDDGNLECPGKACEASYPEGDEVRLRRRAGRDTFDSFSGPCTGKDCTFIVKADSVVKALFIPRQGSVVSAVRLGAADRGSKAGFARGEDGGYAVVVHGGKTATISRFKPTHELLFQVDRTLGTASAPPAVAFFGDDLIVLTSTSSSSTFVRLSADGKTDRFKRLHRGCPSLTKLVVRGDAVFAAGMFEGSGSTCGDRELIAESGPDIVLGRFAVEDGSLTWMAQLGDDKLADRLGALAVSRSEEAYVAFTPGTTGARIVRYNPAGKAFPDVAFGEGKADSILSMTFTADKQLLRTITHVTGTVSFGGTPLGTRAKDGLARVVVVDLDDQLRHQASKLVARSKCGDGWMCGFDPIGGFVHLDDGAVGSVKLAKPRKKKKKKSKKGKKAKAAKTDGDEGSAAKGTFEGFALKVERVAADGAQTWGSSVSGRGRLEPLTVVQDGRSVMLIGVLEGEVTPEGAEPVAAQGTEAVLIRLQD